MIQFKDQPCQKDQPVIGVLGFLAMEPNFQGAQESYRLSSVTQSVIQSIMTM